MEDFRWLDTLILGFCLTSLDLGLGQPLKAQPVLDEVKVSAEAGDPVAQRNLGLMYAGGRGVGQDDVEAVQWLSLAAEQGEARAQGSLGVAYALGKGVSLDYVEAYRWLELATRQSCGESRKMFRRNRDVVVSKMTTSEVKKAKGLVKTWLDSFDHGR